MTKGEVNSVKPADQGMDERNTVITQRLAFVHINYCCMYYCFYTVIQYLSVCVSGILHMDQAYVLACL